LRSRLRQVSGSSYIETIAGTTATVDNTGNQLPRSFSQPTSRNGLHIETRAIKPGRSQYPIII
jgi:hypothetical protein